MRKLTFFLLLLLPGFVTTPLDAQAEVFYHQPAPVEALLPPKSSSKPRIKLLSTR